MRNLIENFASQLEEALVIGKSQKLNTENKNKINKVLLVGLGGSGIGATIAANLCNRTAKVPVLVSKNYFLPAYVDENTLVIINSYSGNTEESVYSLNEALKTKATIVAVSANGQVEKISKENSLNFVKIPGGMPPRSCLGYSLVQNLFILNAFGVIDNSFVDETEKSIVALKSEKQNIIVQAGKLAKELENRIAVIYSVDSFEGVAVRFRQQLNENSKVLAWHHVIPEMNHNEIVGWTENPHKLHVVMLRNTTDFSRNSQRLDICKTVFEKYTDKITEVYSVGESQLEQVFYHVHFGDWVSQLLGELRGVDITEVRVIDYLKGELNKNPIL
jgi:glucose/mannose-6-phosphate isomerase